MRRCVRILYIGVEATGYCFATVCSNRWREPIQCLVAWMVFFDWFPQTVPASSCTVSLMYQGGKSTIMQKMVTDICFFFRIALKFFAVHVLGLTNGKNKLSDLCTDEDTS